MSSPEEITESTVPRRQAASDREQRARGHGEDHHGQRAEHRGLRAGQQPGEHVAALAVEAEQVPAAGPTQASERFGWSGLYGASSGPKNAANVASTITAADTMPAAPVPRSPDSDRARLVPGATTVATATGRVTGRSGAHHWARLPSETRGSSTAYSRSTTQVDHDERGDQHQRDALHDREVLGLRPPGPGRRRGRSG